MPDWYLDSLSSYNHGLVLAKKVAFQRSRQRQKCLVTTYIEDGT